MSLFAAPQPVGLGDVWELGRFVPTAETCFEPVWRLPFLVCLTTENGQDDRGPSSPHCVVLFKKDVVFEKQC